MKKNIFLVAAAVLFFNQLFAQNGLEDVIVEKYYVSNVNDTSVNIDGGVLPVGSVTYRIYLDMSSGYEFQAAFGIPGHELRISTTTLFFNNEDRGATSPTYTKAQAANNTVMLDSWLSVGAACSGNYGILKSLDDGNANVVNADGVLQNADTTAGIPLTQQDGLISGSPQLVTAVGITTQMAVFDNQNDGSNGPVFSTFNGSWASLQGSKGPDSVDNKVLIAQITTDGVFSFELNVQLRDSLGNTEQFVASNAVGTEILFPALNYTSLTTGIEEKTVSVPPADMFFAYPNPTSDILNLEINEQVQGNLSYTIYDMHGRIMMQKDILQKSGKQKEEVEISFLKPGIYTVELNTDGVSSRKQWIKF